MPSLWEKGTLETRLLEAAREASQRCTCTFPTSFQVKKLTLGSFLASGRSVKPNKSACLVALLGKIASVENLQFLLDTGASCNFVSKRLLETCNIDWDLV